MLTLKSNQNFKQPEEFGSLCSIWAFCCVLSNAIFEGVRYNKNSFSASFSSKTWEGNFGPITPFSANVFQVTLWKENASMDEMLSQSQKSFSKLHLISSSENKNRKYNSILNWVMRGRDCKLGFQRPGLFYFFPSIINYQIKNNYSFFASD